MTKLWKMAAGAGLAALTLTTASQAHRLWLLPSNTVLSGEAKWITVDAAISNDLFYFNHHALPLASISVTAPDGDAVDIANAMEGEYRSTFDTYLEDQGTYRIASIRNVFFAGYEHEGERHRFMGRQADFAEALPEGATVLRSSNYLGRVETYVTLGAPTQEVLETTGEGIELAAITHPNDLYEGDAAQFQLLLNGEPYVGAEIELVAGGTRYRDAMGAVNLTTDENGQFSYTWPEAGMYWFEVGHEIEGKAGEPSTSYGYAVTLEVLPL